MLRITLALSAFVTAAALGTSQSFAGDAYSADYGIQQAGYYAEDDPAQYGSVWECWWEDVCDCVRTTRLRGYKRLQRKHRKFLYPEYSVACSPTFGYHHTQWRQFPECDYVWTSAPAATAWPTPTSAAQPAMLTPMLEIAPESSPSGTSPAPYFPEPAPQLTPVQPAVPPAPPAEPPTDSAASLPVRADSLFEFVSQPRAN